MAIVPKNEEASPGKFRSGLKSRFLLTGAIALQLLLFSSIAAAGDGRTIIVGGDRDYPPYEFLDKDGNPAGYNVDLTRAIAEVMGLKVEFRLGGWADVRGALDAGKVDVLQGMSYSDDRARFVDFSPPHTIIHHSLFARRGVPGVKSLEDLRGKEVTLHGRGVMHDHLVERGIDTLLVLTETPADALRLIASGKHDYALVASLPGMYLIKELHLSNIEAVTKSIASRKYCYAVRKGNSEVLARFNEGLAILKKTGQYQAIYDKWLGVLEPPRLTGRKIVKYGAMVIVPLLLILGGTIMWSQTLKKRVAQRTEELECEIIERKRAAKELRIHQEQLVQADKMAALGILVSGVCHEINNPNGLILLNMPLLIEVFNDAGPILDAHYREHGDFAVGGLNYSRIRTEIPLVLAEMHDSAGRIKRIVDDLKNFARRDNANLVDLLDLNEVGKIAVRLVDNTIRKSTSRFTACYAENPAKVRGNAQRLEQVVVNLILNACHALQDTGKGIFLSTLIDRDSGEVVLQVRDEGIGISAENIPHLTDPFFTTKREAGGTGLGLSVSAGIVKEHRGLLHFNSLPGKGTTVTLRFPLAEETAAA